VLLLAACAPLTAGQIMDLDRWSTAAANHCASAGQCPDDARCVDATAAALSLSGTYDEAAKLCRAYP
jgi:hypothetical protein